MYLLGNDDRAVRTALLLELNSCFTRIWKDYQELGTPEQKLFLKRMIDDIRQLVEEAKPD